MFQNLKTRVGNMAAALKKYNPLLIELVSRDIKVRYRKSVLGMLWTVLKMCIRDSLHTVCVQCYCRAFLVKHLLEFPMVQAVAYLHSEWGI